MKRVLIITYYWPPSGGSAVLRWLKFTKYLRDFGWEPIIYTPENPEPQEVDESLLTDIPDNLEIIKTRIIEPYTVYKWLTGRKKEDRLGVALMEKKKSGIVGKFSLWIRSNLFIPDPRMLWIIPSAKFLSSYLKKNPVDIVISTGPPHSMHLIALKVHQKLGIKWVADFRDPWTNIDFYNDLTLTRLADKKHKVLEHKVLSTADYIITVSPGMTQDFKLRGIDNVITITNGFDEEPNVVNPTSNRKFSILHLGSLPKSRNPENLWKVLSELAVEMPEMQTELEIRLIGKSDHRVDDSIHQYGLTPFVTRIPFVQHSQTLALLKNAAVMLLCINNTSNAKGILTNKFFEYLSARRPIIGIGPVDGDAGVILKETGSGRFFEYYDTTTLKEWVVQLFDLYSQHKLSIEGMGIEKYSRKNLTDELSHLLNTIIR